MGGGPALATALFPDRLAEAVERKRSQLLVGLDPRPDLLPVELAGDAHLSREAAAEACARFCCGIVDAVAPHVVGVKPQLAFFELLGSDGLRAFEGRHVAAAGQHDRGGELRHHFGKSARCRSMLGNLRTGSRSPAI